ncbi:hypothetical protein ACNKHQ_01055 [Shigella flexneri]
MKSKEGLEERLEFLFPDGPSVVRMTSVSTRTQVINQMGFPGYFLIVMEFIQWSQDNGIPSVRAGAGGGVAGGLRPQMTDLFRWNLTCCSNVS